MLDRTNLHFLSLAKVHKKTNNSAKVNTGLPLTAHLNRANSQFQTAVMVAATQPNSTVRPLYSSTTAANNTCWSIKAWVKKPLWQPRGRNRWPGPCAPPASPPATDVHRCRTAAFKMLLWSQPPDRNRRPGLCAPPAPPPAIDLRRCQRRGGQSQRWPH